ncbi:MAG TPA: aldehyde dehydrogenase family protein [Pirellulales bacterium]|jgi:aldehyde dehydrogenase (NAD+)|nr:aldehyde dehydrogenase family protein [Pirellulales bacterium]
MTTISATTWSGRQFIDGRWQTAAGETLEDRNPARADEIIGLCPRGTKADVDLAVAAARRAFVPWRRTSRIQRGELFGKLAALIQSDVEQLATLLAMECGKVLDEARAEVIEGLHMVQYVFGTARQPVGSIAASEIVGKDLFVRRKPRGVVGVITPWNFPFAVPFWMLAPSLLEGNTVVFKPSEETPAIGEHLVRLFDEAGFPPGTINLVHGLGEEVGEALAGHADVDVVCFTGSFAVGSRIRQLAAKSDHKTCAIEAGSKSAVIVCEDAPLDLACDAAILSAFKTTGQRCVSAGRILIHSRLFDVFAARFVRQAKLLRFGDPLDRKNFAGPLINEAAVEKVSYYNDLAVKEGAEVLLDGGRMTDPEHAGGHFMSPFVYRQRHGAELRTIREEVFGPHVALIPFEDDDDAIRIYNDTPYGLSMAVITDDYRRWRYYRDECDYGMGYVNLPCIGAEVHLPFGGVKRSGNGRPSAAALVDAVTHKTAFTVNYDRSITMAQGMSAAVKPGEEKAAD